MFDLETCLVRKGVGRNAAHIINLLFGDSITQKRIVAGDRGNGEINIGNLTIKGDSFVYKNMGEMAFGMDMIVGAPTTISFNDGKLVLGIMGPDLGDFNSDVRFIEIPNYGTMEGATYKVYNADSVYDLADVLTYTEVENESQANYFKYDLLTKPGLFDSLSYLPDEKEYLDKSGISYDRAVAVIGEFAQNPSLLAETNNKAIMRVPVSSGHSLR